MPCWTIKYSILKHYIITPNDPLNRNQIEDPKTLFDTVLQCEIHNQIQKKQLDRFYPYYQIML